jgi:hypothetical protein
MSCCTETPMMPTKKEFLESKLKNFRAFLEPHCTTDPLKQRLASLQTIEDVMPYVLQVTAMSKAGQSELLVEQFCSEFGNINEEFRHKVRRYLEMFVTVLGS